MVPQRSPETLTLLEMVVPPEAVVDDDDGAAGMMPDELAMTLTRLRTFVSSSPDTMLPSVWTESPDSISSVVREASVSGATSPWNSA